MTPREDRERRALESWPALARAAGLDASAFAVGRGWHKGEAHRDHVVLSLDGPGGPVILKRAFLPEDPGEVEGILGALHEARQALSGDPVNAVPEVLASDTEARAYLMDFAPGRPLRDLFEESSVHAPLLRRAGAWLAAYHRGTVSERREYRPHFMARHLEKLAGQAESGARRVRQAKRFAKLARRVAQLEEVYAGRETVIAAKHGDLNTRNLLFDGGQLTCLDFQPRSTAPVGHDIARLLVNYASTAADIDRVPPGEVLPPEALAAFFEGYDLIGPDDPSVGFLLRVQVMTDWNRLPARRSLNNLVRFRNLEALAEKALSS